MKNMKLGSAFTGGIVLSLIELANMLNQKENPDIYFLGGLLIAGILGITGYLITGADNFKTAFVSGVSAPQLLGGIVKVGSTGIQTISLLVFPLFIAYAQPNMDTINILITTQNVDNVKIKTTDSLYTVEDSCKIKIKYQDSVTVYANKETQKIALPKSNNVIVNIKASESIANKLFRGIVAQKSLNKHVGITVISLP